MNDTPKQQDERPELPVLKTERLRLRALTMDDLDGFFRLVKDPDIVDYSGRPPRKTLEEARARIKERITKGLDANAFRYCWAVADKQSGDYLGEITLHSLDSKNKRAELARGLVAEARGKGYAAEAARAVLDFAFGTLELNRVQAVTRTTNESSQKSLEGLGFTKEGTLREYWTIEGKPVTTTIYSLLRDEYHQEKAV